MQEIPAGGASPRLRQSLESGFVLSFLIIVRIRIFVKPGDPGIRREIREKQREKEKFPIEIERLVEYT